MQRKFMNSIIVLFTMVMMSCSPKQSEIVVAEFGNYKIQMDEFEKAYAKNVGNIEEAKKRFS